MNAKFNLRETEKKLANKKLAKEQISQGKNLKQLWNTRW